MGLLPLEGKEGKETSGLRFFEENEGRKGKRYQGKGIAENGTRAVSRRKRRQVFRVTEGLTGPLRGIRGHILKEAPLGYLERSKKGLGAPRQKNKRKRGLARLTPFLGRVSR